LIDWIGSMNRIDPIPIKSLCSCWSSSMLIHDSSLIKGLAGSMPTICRF
jgi:hypothetical protein